MAFKSPSGSNTFSISWDSTGALVSATRDKGKFKLPQYCEYVPTTKRVFRYLKLDLDEPARVPTTQEFAWAPGQDAPTQPNIGAFQYVDTGTVKYAPAWILPDEDLDQAPWDLEASQMGIILQKMMTIRTILVANVAQTSANWPTSNTDTATNLNGGAGKFDVASSDPASVNYLAIAKALVKAATTIVLQTNGVMKWADLNFVGSPTLFNKMGNTSEIWDYTKGSPNAFPRQKGEEQYQGEFNMPGEYKSVKLIAEDAVKVTSRPNASTGLATSGTRAFVWADSFPCLFAKKDGNPAQFGGKAMSTIELYHYRNMEVYTKDDPDNERRMGRVVDDIVAVLPFGQSGFGIQSAL